jgi:enhancing lycopene biosynthesis protein 2
MLKIGVCLSGCGQLDGSEIHEAVSTLIAIDQAGARTVCMAPDVAQSDVVNHLQRVPSEGENRNVLVESARIARGEIEAVALVNPEELDALIFPGGFGAAKNLCTFAADGTQCSVDPDVEILVADMLEAGKPVGAICIAPAMIARICGNRGIKADLTIGNDQQTAQAIEGMGVNHCDCAATDFIIDEKYKIVSTPAYMLGKGPAEVFTGISKLVQEVIRLAEAAIPV